MSKVINKLLNIDLIPWVSGAIGGAIGVFRYLYGVENNDILFVLITCMSFDYITGLLVGYNLKTLSSQVGFKGICKKLAIMVIVAIGHLFDSFIFKDGAVLMRVCVYFYIANEGLSIIENCANLGLPVPKKLTKALIQLKKSNEDSSDTIKND